MLFANDDKINKLIDGTKNLKLIIHNERSMFSKISNITINGEINFYSPCIDWVLQYLKLFLKKNKIIYYKIRLNIKQCYSVVWSVEKKNKKQNPKKVIKTKKPEE